MPRISLWNSQRKSANYQYIDRMMSSWFNQSGPSIFLHKYIGTYGEALDHDGNPVATDAASRIQDVVLMENRDRRYDPNVKELRGTYTMPDYEMSLFQFGSWATADTIFINFHLNDMLAIVGRKIIPGDVIELPNFRDDALVNRPNKAVNKYYTVAEAKTPPEGFQGTWWPHIWRVKCEPMMASQETADILSQQAKNPFGLDNGTLGDLLTNTAPIIGVNEEIMRQAEKQFLRRNFETGHLWIVPGDRDQSAWIYTGDGKPPNGITCQSGPDWPTDPQDGTYFLRTDYLPNALYRYEGNGWELQELDYRDVWTAAGRLMLQFINNRDTATFKDGTTQPSKQDLYTVVRPVADFGGDVHPSDAVLFPDKPDPYRGGPTK